MSSFLSKVRSVVDPVGHHVTKKAEKKLIKKLGFDPEDPLGIESKTMEKIKKGLGYDFERFNFDQMYKEILKHPQRLLQGVDPLSTKLNNEILGTDYDPVINQLGGPTNQRFVDYVEQGGDPRAASNAGVAHQIAAAVASWYAGGALAGAVGGLGGGAAAAGTAGAGATGTAAGAGIGSQLGAVLSQMTPAMGRAVVAAGAQMGDDTFPIKIQEIINTSGNRPRGLTAGLPGMARGGSMNYAEGGGVEDPREVMEAIQQVSQIPGGGEMLMSAVAEQLQGNRKPTKTLRMYNREPMAEGGLAAAAEETQAGGRNDDEVLLHVSPEEYEAIVGMWGEPDINPNTGLPEYGFLSDIWKKVKNVVKKIVKSPVFSFLAPIALNTFLPGAGAWLGKALGAGSGAMGAHVGNALIKGGLGAATGGKEGALAGVVGSLTMGGGETIGGDALGGAGADIGGKLGLTGAAAKIAGNAVIGGVGGEIGGGGFTQGALGNAMNAMMMEPVNKAANDMMGNMFNPETQGIGGGEILGEGMSPIAAEAMAAQDPFGGQLPGGAEMTGQMSPVPGGATQMTDLMSGATDQPWYADAWDYTKENPLLVAGGIAAGAGILGQGGTELAGEGPPELPANFLEGIPEYTFDRGRTEQPADLYYTYGIAGGPQEEEFNFFTGNVAGTAPGGGGGQPLPGTGGSGGGTGGGGGGPRGRGPGRGGRGGRGGGGDPRRQQQQMPQGMGPQGIPITDPQMAAELAQQGYRIEGNMAYPPGMARGGPAESRGRGQGSFGNQNMYQNREASYLPGLGPGQHRTGPTKEQTSFLEWDLGEGGGGPWTKMLREAQEKARKRTGYYDATPFGNSGERPTGGSYLPGLAGGGYASGGGSGRDDTIEALLSDGEYVMDAETVALLGDGSNDHGAQRLDEMREELRKHKGQGLSRGKFSNDAKRPMQYMKKGGGVTKGTVKKIAKKVAGDKMNEHIRHPKPKGHGSGKRGGQRQTKRYKTGGRVRNPLMHARLARIAAEQGEE